MLICICYGGAVVVNLNQGIVRAIASTAQAPKEGDDKWGWPTMGYLFLYAEQNM